MFTIYNPSQSPQSVLAFSPLFQGRQTNLRTHPLLMLLAAFIAGGAAFLSVQDTSASDSMPPAVCVDAVLPENSFPFIRDAIADKYQTGVGFGGWLVMEQWMFPNIPLAHGPQGESELEYIRNMTEYLGPEYAIRSMHNHWANFITDEDLKSLADFGVTHVKIPVGWWIMDPPVSRTGEHGDGVLIDKAGPVLGGARVWAGFSEDGFVTGGIIYLERMIKRLKKLNIRVIITVQTLPGGTQSEKVYQGDIFKHAGFWCDRNPRTGRPYREEGDEFILRLSRWILDLEKNPETSGVVYALEPINEPQLGSELEICPKEEVGREGAKKTDVMIEWFYTTLARLREILPPERYAIICNWMAVPDRNTQTKILYSQENVWPDRHLYEAFNRCEWGTSPQACYQDMACRDRTRCNTCCGTITPALGIPEIVGEWSLSTCDMFGKGPGVIMDRDWLATRYADNVSTYRSLGFQGDFFWTAKIGVNYDPTIYPPGWSVKELKPEWWGRPSRRISPLEQVPADYLLTWHLLELIRQGIAVPARDLQIKGACEYTVPGSNFSRYDCSGGCEGKPCGCEEGK